MIRQGSPLNLSPSGPASKSGQALLESFGIIMLLCLILFGMVQYVLILTANEVLQYSADASVRARSVGMNPFMVYKVSRITSIPNAGRMTTPSGHSAGDSWLSTNVDSMFRWHRDRQPEERLGEIWRNPGSSQFTQVEDPRIPLVLESRSPGEMLGYLNYERWEPNQPNAIENPLYRIAASGNLEITLQQDYPILMPFARAFIDNDTIRIQKSSQYADHAELYLE